MPSRFWLLLDIDSSLVVGDAVAGDILDVVATAHHHHGQVTAF